MLAGLIFATEDADDRRDTLAATLPFGGMTLVEYQARLLIGAGAGHILVAVSRVTPALLGAISRIKRRGVPVDVVRSAQEAAAKAHPLAEVIIFADSLVTTDAATVEIAGQPGDVLMTVADDGTASAVERLDAGTVWAGVAKIGAGRLVEIATMPRDYDFQSTMLRVAVQTGARRTPLPASAIKSGHGVERTGAALNARSNAVVASLANQRRGWADRFVFTPITRLFLPRLVARGVPDWGVFTAGALIGAGSVLALALDFVRVGFPFVLVAVALLCTGSLLSWLRGDEKRGRAQELAILALGAVAVMVTGMSVSLNAGQPTALVLATVLVAIGAISERVPGPRRPWYGSGPGYLLLLAPAIAAGYATPALAAVALYAIATLAAAVEALRKKA